ncbi:DUF4920 domain-containing protein [Pedobacter sp. SD-b]|uniref:DUF4920 domain-containing protein n=1 Tax=Pedobacter segetis TaxID=2793069 RepID=A0ABS1BLD8_9SPHI|nr:DUF4920 domain-containing protein [Pedobacter segetis]MBK0383126.1 DUF4920 domain-containing protein [Pedobacter segetis]
MKINILSLLLLALLATSCVNREKVRLRGAQNIKGTVYGDSILDNNVRELSTLLDLVHGGEREKVTVKGVVNNVCNKDGNWVTIKLPNNDLMKVNFEEGKFKIPNSTKGKTVVIKGMAKTDIFSEDQQKQLAQEIDAPEKEIAKIKGPKRMISFDAIGMVVL